MQALRHPDASGRDEVVMSDGRTATIRTLTPEDEGALVALHEHLDDATLRLRFFNVSHSAGRLYVEHVLRAGPDDVLALVAEVDGRVVGLGTAERVSPGSAEVAFVVADDERGHGLGTLLLEHLAHACTVLGIGQLTADVLPDNTQMVQVLRDAGYAMTRHFESGVMRYQLSTEETQAATAAAQHRRATAADRAAGR